MTDQDGVPHGLVHTFMMDSSASTIYPGIARVPGTRPELDPANPAKRIVQSGPAKYTRRVAVYIPQAVRRRHHGALHRRRRRSRPAALHRARQPDRAEARAADDRDLDRQRQRRRPGQPARPRVRHDVRPLRRVRRDRGAAARREAVQRQADEGSGRARHDGLQLRRIRGAGDGLVSHRSLSPRADLLGHLREPAVAVEPGDARRRLGLPQDADPEQPEEAAPPVAAGQRPRQLQRQRRHARLGAGQPADGQGAGRQGLRLPVPVHARRRALRPRRQAADAAAGARVGVEGLPRRARRSSAASRQRPQALAPHHPPAVVREARVGGGAGVGAPSQPPAIRPTAHNSAPFDGK